MYFGLIFQIFLITRLYESSNNLFISNCFWKIRAMSFCSVNFAIPSCSDQVIFGEFQFGWFNWNSNKYKLNLKTPKIIDDSSSDKYDWNNWGKNAVVNRLNNILNKTASHGAGLECYNKTSTKTQWIVLTVSAMAVKSYGPNRIIWNNKLKNSHMRVFPFRTDGRFLSIPRTSPNIRLQL